MLSNTHVGFSVIQVTRVWTPSMKTQSQRSLTAFASQACSTSTNGTMHSDRWLSENRRYSHMEKEDTQMKGKHQLISVECLQEAIQDPEVSSTLRLACFANLIIYTLGSWLWKMLNYGAEGVEDLPDMMKLWAQSLYPVSKQRTRYILKYKYECMFVCIWPLVYSCIYISASSMCVYLLYICTYAHAFICVNNMSHLSQCRVNAHIFISTFNQ